MKKEPELDLDDNTRNRPRDAPWQDVPLGDGMHRYRNIPGLFPGTGRCVAGTVAGGHCKLAARYPSKYCEYHEAYVGKKIREAKAKAEIRLLELSLGEKRRVVRRRPGGVKDGC